MPPGLAYLLAPRLEPGSRAYTGGPFLPTEPALRLELIALLKLAKDFGKLDVSKGLSCALHPPLTHGVQGSC